MKQAFARVASRALTFGAALVLCASLLGLCACAQDGGTKAATTDEPAQSAYALTKLSYATASGTATRTFALDGAGNIVSVAVDQSYGDLGSEQSETSYECDEQGTLTASSSEEGSIAYQPAYDDEGRLASLTWEDKGQLAVWELSYDADGQLAELVRRVSVPASDASSSSTEQVTRYVFDANGWLTSFSEDTLMSDGSSYASSATLAYEGDDADRPSEATITRVDEGSTSSSYVTTLSYDDAGNLVRAQTDDGRTFDMEYEQVFAPSATAELACSLKAPGYVTLFLGIGF